MSPGTAPVDVGGRQPLSRVHVRTPRPSAAPAPRPVGRGGAAGAAGVGDSGQSRDTLARKAAELRVPRRAQLISGSSRSAAAIAGFFGVFALLIAAVGLYALVARRRRRAHARDRCAPGARIHFRWGPPPRHGRWRPTRRGGPRTRPRRRARRRTRDGPASVRTVSRRSRDVRGGGSRSPRRFHVWETVTRSPPPAS
jgi:hypothetical protein